MFVDQKNFESCFSDRSPFQTFAVVEVLPLRTPETLSSLSKSRISIFNAHLALFVRRVTSHNSISKYRHFRKLTLELALERNVANRCRTGEEVNVRSSACKEVRH